MPRKVDSYFPAIALACLLALFGIGASAQTRTFWGVPVTVSISPVSAILLTGGTQQFTATVTGSRNSAVTWSATGGTVSSSGLYTAPTTTGTYTVTATSVADTTKSASAAVTVTAPSPYTLAFVQVAAATPRLPQFTVTVVYPAAQTAGDLNVVVVGWNDSTSKVTSVSDSCGNAYSLAIGPTTSTGLSQSIYYAKDIVSGSNAVTVTFNQAAAFPDIRILEYAGLDTVSPLDVTAAAVGNSNSASSGPATTTATSELILGADTIATTTTGLGSGFTSRIITSPDSDLVEDKVVNTTGSYSATANLSSGSWVMQMATFKAAGTTSIMSPAITVSVTPSSTNLATGATQQFTDTVTGTTNTAVTWSASCGTVTASGLYTAPTAAGSCAVTAASQADTTKSASAVVTVSVPSAQAVSFVQIAAAAPQSPQSTVTVVYPAAQTAGNLNVVVVGWNDSTSNVTSVSDSSGNAYTLAVGPTIGTGLSQSIYYAKDIVSGSNAVTVTFNQAATNPDIRILEYAGLDTVSPLDVTAAAVGNSSSASSSPATTTATSELILGADTIATTTTGLGSGFTSRIITSPDSDLVEDKVVSTTGSYSATANLSSGSWVMQTATFKAAGAVTSVAVSVRPSSTTLATGATQQFTATVTGTTNTAVTWSTSCGTITASGLYTAPTAAGSCAVTAASQADTTKSASAVVTVSVPSAQAVSFVQIAAAAPQSPQYTGKR